MPAVISFRVSGSIKTINRCAHSHLLSFGWYVFAICHLWLNPLDPAQYTVCTVFLRAAFWVSCSARVEYVRYRTVYTVRRQSSYVRLSRVFTPTYCVICTPNLRSVFAPRVRFT
ncbi:hypothetical protein EVAR_99263_1 [Eumeta japonica]|uniref:Uncharacterized protein n=1 Tax=Eumeta variegata TaxID=151549 RepID=A0A4C1ZB53_EUMVA|nr:hypothetical protein EVAR_99263_1 [Eumeta japonica]